VKELAVVADRFHVKPLSFRGEMRSLLRVTSRLPASSK
jgi:hypothetical protein